MSQVAHARGFGAILEKWLARWTPDREVRVRPWLGHFCCVLGKDKSHTASLHPGVEMGTSKLAGKPDKMLGGYLRWTSIPSRRSSNTPNLFMLRKPG